MPNATFDLAAALRQRLAIIADKTGREDPERHMAELRAVSEKIQRLSGELPKPVDPQLAHYLQRQSYDKALQYLEARF